MSLSVSRVRSELEGMGLSVFEYDWNGSRVVAFDYQMESGTHRGKEVRVGVSFQEEGYPEYPPHWIHINPPIDDQRGGAKCGYIENGREWLAMSRPPGDIWDQLPTKHMSAYISEHLRRIWRDV